MLIKKNNNRILIYISIALAIIISSCSTDASKSKSNYIETLGKTKVELNYIDTNYLRTRAKRLVINGSSLQQQYRYAEAILEFQDALKSDSSAGIYYAIAKCYKEIYKIDNAQENLIKSLELDSTFVPALELMAEIYLVKFQFDNAIDIYNRIIELQPLKHNKVALARLYEFKDQKKAIELYKELLNSNEDVAILERLAELYSNAKDTAAFIEVLEKIHKYNSQNSYIIGALLENYIVSQMYNQAEKILNSVDNNFSSDDLIPMYSRSAELLIRLPKDSAGNLVKTFLSKIDNRFYLDWYINFISGLLSERIKDSVKAEYFLNHSLDLSDSLYFVPIEVSLYYSRHNNNKKAIEIINKYESNFPNESKYPFYKGMIYNIMGVYDEALKESFRALSLDSSNAEHWSQIGYIYNTLNKNDSSDYFYEKALSLDSLNPLINNNYAYSLSERKIHLERALEMIKIAIGAEPENSSYLDTFGWIQFQLGNLDTALIYIKKSIDSGASTSEVYDHLGEVFYKMGNTTEAKEAWKKAIQIEPNNNTILERLRLLE